MEYTLSIALVATAATVSLMDLVPGEKNPLRLKDLNTPQEELASHSEVLKLIFGTKID